MHSNHVESTFKRFDIEVKSLSFEIYKMVIFAPSNTNRCNIIKTITKFYDNSFLEFLMLLLLKNVIIIQPANFSSNDSMRTKNFIHYATNS